MPEIPEDYREHWKSFKTNDVLYHLTTAENYRQILRHGQLSPYDPAPKHWSGMHAVFMAYPSDPLYQKTLPDVLAHVLQKHQQLVRLHIKTKNQLYKSVDPKRTFQVASLDPIDIADVVEVEEVQ